MGAWGLVQAGYTWSHDEETSPAGKEPKLSQYVSYVGFFRYDHGSRSGALSSRVGRGR